MFSPPQCLLFMNVRPITVTQVSERTRPALISIITPTASWELPPRFCMSCYLHSAVNQDDAFGVFLNTVIITGSEHVVLCLCSRSLWRWTHRTRTVCGVQQVLTLIGCSCLHQLPICTNTPFITKVWLWFLPNTTQKMYFISSQSQTFAWNSKAFHRRPRQTGGVWAPLGCSNRVILFTCGLVTLVTMLCAGLACI